MQGVGGSSPLVFTKIGKYLTILADFLSFKLWISDIRCQTIDSGRCRTVGKIKPQIRLNPSVAGRVAKVKSMPFFDFCAHKHLCEIFSVERQNGIEISSARKGFRKGHNRDDQHRSADDSPKSEKLCENQQDQPPEFHRIPHFETRLSERRNRHERHINYRFGYEPACLNCKVGQQQSPDYAERIRKRRRGVH